MTCFEVRPPCPKCGMNMVKIGARFECLRCGHVEQPAQPKGRVTQDVEFGAMPDIRSAATRRVR